MLQHIAVPGYVEEKEHPKATETVHIPKKKKVLYFLFHPSNILNVLSATAQIIFDSAF